MAKLDVTSQDHSPRPRRDAVSRRIAEMNRFFRHLGRDAVVPPVADR